MNFNNQKSYTIIVNSFLCDTRGMWRGIFTEENYCKTPRLFTDFWNKSIGPLKLILTEIILKWHIDKKYWQFHLFLKVNCSFYSFLYCESCHLAAKSLMSCYVDAKQNIHSSNNNGEQKQTTTQTVCFSYMILQ